MSLTAVTDEQIRAAVVYGNRPPLDVIKGNDDLMTSFAKWLVPRRWYESPGDLVSFARRLIPQCWHVSPDKRPTFDGKHNVVDVYSRPTTTCT